MLAQLLLSLSFLVAVHEFGHLIAAKYYGMRVEQFSIGFPPKIWSFKKGETEYALSAIPLGGYVKISGMIDESLDTDAMKQPPQPWEFRSKPAWQRLIVMLGGITVNMVVGVLIFIGLTFAFGETHILKDVVNQNGGFQVGSVGESIGLKTGDKIVKINGQDYEYLEDLIRPELLLSDKAYYTVERDGQLIDIPIPQDFIQEFSKRENAGNFIFYRVPPVVGQIEKGMIADRVGLQKGDRIIDVNGSAVRYNDEIRTIIDSASSATVSFKVARNGDTLSFSNVEFTAPIARETDFENQPRSFGFYTDVREFVDRASYSVKYGFFESIPIGTERAFTTLATQVKAFGKVISGALSAKKSLSGPLGIMQHFGGEWNWERFWTLTGVLSLVLAFMNLLPIPALDGGHVMFLTYEMVSRRKPSDKFLETAQKVGMMFLLALMVFIFANDILKFFDH